MPQERSRAALASLARWGSSFTELPAFLAVGIFNTILGLLIIFGCLYFLDMPPLAANAVGYAIGLAISFTLNGTLTFRQSRLSAAAFGRFVVVFALAYAANAVVVEVLSPFNRYFAQAVAMPVYTVLSFTGCRVFVFPRKQEPNDGAGHAVR